MREKKEGGGRGSEEGKKDGGKDTRMDELVS